MQPVLDQRHGAPFPHFGGKSRVAAKVWQTLGDVNNYIEPFAGSLAVLLARPTPPRIETVNDLDGFITNTWRSIQAVPEKVFQWADWPVSELDLHARHRWLVDQEPELVEKLRADPDYCDPKIAGWWLWGISQWIGRGWCAGSQNQQLPRLGDAGTGVHAPLRRDLLGEFRGLSERLRYVRIVCGDWTRVLGPSVTTKNGLTGIFFDPPYGAKRDKVYREDNTSVAAEVRGWCLGNGDDPQLRIALCGYLGEGHEQLAKHGWTLWRWKAAGGYGSQGQGRGRSNSESEAIWFSPHCIQPQNTLFMEAFHGTLPSTP